MAKTQIPEIRDGKLCYTPAQFRERFGPNIVITKNDKNEVVLLTREEYQKNLPPITGHGT